MYIGEDLKPTLENVSREFIIKSMTKIMYDIYYPNFNFIFNENEAIKYIENVIKYNININLDKDCQKLIKDLENKKYDNIKPCMIINDYKLFFNLLVELYKKVIEYYFKDVNNRESGFPQYEMRNYFTYIWLRMLPEDFNNPELFLRKQVDMMNNELMSKYDREIIVGNMPTLGNNLLSIKNCVSECWNENSNEFRIRIYDKETYRSENYLNEYFTLPLIRYGIYEKNGVKVCSIGSIQNTLQYYPEYYLHKIIERKKYKLNKNVDKKFQDIEPKLLLSLVIFINILIKEEIYDIEIPCLYTIDNEYHKKWGKQLINQFQERYKGIKKSYFYEADKELIRRVYKKEDLISELKCDKYIKLFERLIYHYNDFEIIKYPLEIDSNLHIRLSKINSINNEMLEDVNNLINNLDKDKVMKVC